MLTPAFEIKAIRYRLPDLERIAATEGLSSEGLFVLAPKRPIFFPLGRYTL